MIEIDYTPQRIPVAARPNEPRFTAGDFRNSSIKLVHTGTNTEAVYLSIFVFFPCENRLGQRRQSTKCRLNSPTRVKQRVKKFEKV